MHWAACYHFAWLEEAIGTFEPHDHTFAICAYGNSEYLEECILSLLSQDVATNILIATSTPSSFIEQAASRHGLPLFVNDRSEGIGADWNFAISCATTPLVTVAHQDDVYLGGYAQHMLAGANAALDRGERPLIWFCDYAELRGGQVVEENHLLEVKRRLLAPMRKPGAPVDKGARRRMLSLGSPICCPSVALCLDGLCDAGLALPVFSQQLKCDLDWDAWARIADLDGSFVFDPEILMRHRIHEDSATTELIAGDVRREEDLAIFSRFWPAPIARLLNWRYQKGTKSNAL